MVNPPAGGPERKSQRASCRAAASFRLPGQRATAALITTVSLGGAFVKSPRPPARGTVLLLEFALDAHRIRTRGRVVWNSRDNPAYRRRPHAQAGFGAEFEDLSSQDHEFLDRYVRHRMRAFRLLAFELERQDLDPDLVRAIFRQLCPAESSHLRHIRKIVQQELRHFRLRK